MTANSVSLGRVFGIELRLDYSWFLVFALVTWMLVSHHFPMTSATGPGASYWLAGILTSLLFFASVVAHELSHSVVSQALGVPVYDITLFLFGGAARLSREPERPRDELLIASVGPVTSIALGAGFGALAWLTSGANTTLHSAATWLAWVNIALGLFNLIPGFPLDGGRIFRAIVWAVTGKLHRATRIAAATGRVVALGFVLWGVWQFFGGHGASGLWIAFIGWYLDGAAARAYQEVGLQELLGGHTVREVLMPDCPRLRREQTLDAVVDRDVLPSGRRCFPVMDGERLEGLLTLHRIKTVPRERWAVTRVEDVMIDREALRTVRSDDALSTVFERMTSEDINQFPVTDNSRFLGMVARDRLLQFIRTRSELGVPPVPQGQAASP